MSNFEIHFLDGISPVKIKPHKQKCLEKEACLFQVAIAQIHPRLLVDVGSVDAGPKRLFLSSPH